MRSKAYSKPDRRCVVLVLFILPFFLTSAFYNFVDYRAKDLEYHPPARFSIDPAGALNVWGNGWRNGSWIVVPIKPQTNAIRFQAKNTSYGTSEPPWVGLAVGKGALVDSVAVVSQTFSWYTLEVPSTQDSFVRLVFMNDAFIQDSLDINLVIDSIRVSYVMASLDTLKGRSVIIRWNRNTEPDLAGYKLYYGNASRDYRFVRTDMGLDTAAVMKPDYFKTWYVAVTAYDTAANESDFSEEVAFYWLPPDTVKRDTLPPRPPLILRPEAIDKIVLYFKQ